MISFNELGRKGNLGNQMFQYASLRGIAAHRGFDWCIPPQDETRIHDYALQKYFKLPNLKVENVNNPELPTFHTKNQRGADSTGFGFDKWLFNHCPDNVNLNGFFQSDSYFRHIESEIKQDFTFQDSYLEKASKFADSVGEFTSLHIRRGDYLTKQQFHPVLAMNYYVEALSLLEPLPIIILTNDKEWVENSKILELGDVRIADFDDYGVDMCLMTMASQSIIANSSFSWWGAWLGHARKIIAPITWFGRKLSGHDTSQLVPPTWVSI